MKCAAEEAGRVLTHDISDNAQRIVSPQDFDSECLANWSSRTRRPHT